MDTVYYAGRKAFTILLRLGLRIKFGGFPANPDFVIQIPSRDTGRNIKAHVYKSSSGKTPSPVLVNFAGSGFILPLLGSDDEYCRRVARETDFTVLDIEYRVAPEDPYPAPVNDAEDAVKYMLARPDDFDLNKIAVSGFSAGGCLAMVTASSLFPRDTINAVLTFYPLVDVFTDPASKVPPELEGSNNNWQLHLMMRTFHDYYYPDRGEGRKDPRVSPAYADAASYPQNVLSIAAAKDMLAPELARLTERIKAVPGKNAVYKCFAGVEHGWDKVPKEGTADVQAKEEAYAMAVDFLKNLP